MSLLQMNRGSKAFATRVLFDQASFVIQPKEHIGVIGPNGAGKSTLFKILVGRETLDAGDLTKMQGLRIGYLEQEDEWPLDLTAEEHLTQISHKAIWELKRLGADLGLNEEHWSRPLQQLSGGYRMRMKLLGLIGLEPDLMLLDEPTNYLDLESLLALEKFLVDYAGAFLLISHDREFLLRTTESTLEVENGDITKFPGHIDDYFAQKAQLREILEAQAANLDSKRKQIQEFVDRFRAKASKARQAQSRMRQLEKMEEIAIADLPVRARIRIPEPPHIGREALALEGAELGYGEFAVLKSVNLRLVRGQHVGVVGVNGAGKSTLLRSMAGQLPLLRGQYKLAPQVSLAYFSQHSAEQLLANETVLEALHRSSHPSIGAQDVLNLAGSLLFGGDDVHKPIQVLSGGERSRVALGQVLLQCRPLLILDEPTNHLDFETVEALTEALRDFTGTVLVVSHDRGFIGRVAKQILEIRNGTVEFYPGNYSEYVWSLQNGSLKERQAELKSIERPIANAKSSDVATETRRATSKRLLAEIRQQQKQIDVLEKKLTRLTGNRDELTQKLIGTKGAAAEEFGKSLAICMREIESAEDELLQHLEAKDRAEREFKQLTV